MNKISRKIYIFYALFLYLFSNKYAIYTMDYITKFINK